MKLFFRSAWRYVLLITILFAIVATVSRFIIVYIEEQLPGPAYAEIVWELSVAIWALTMGCLFLAGALGLWAIRSVVGIEGRRRIGRFVDNMDYLSDGVLALNRSGRIIGSNPAARQLAQASAPTSTAPTLRDVFPSLTQADLQALLNPSRLHEIERNCVYSGGLHALRFRSQPSEDVILVLLSDITDQRAHEIQQRQMAQLRIVSRIAAGVAHDFNNILCAIAGHAEILRQEANDPEGQPRALKIIAEEINKGSRLSRQLLELSRSARPGSPSARLSQDVEDAAALLRSALSSAWTVNVFSAGKFPAVALSSAQIEQAILNLGLLIADTHPQPGAITIVLKQPGQGPLEEVGDQFAAVIIIATPAALIEKDLTPFAGAAKALSDGDECGVIFSIVKPMVEQAHGRLDWLKSASGLYVYRLCLPHWDMPTQPLQGTRASGQDRHLNHWRVLVGGTSQELEVLKRHLRDLGASVIERATLDSLLADDAALRTLDVIVLDETILGLVAEGILRALYKLYPRLGIVVLGQEPQRKPAELSPSKVFIAHGAGLKRIVAAILQASQGAKSIAAAP